MKRITFLCTAAACSALFASNAFAQTIWDSTSDDDGNVYVSNPGEGCETPPGSGTFLGDKSLLLNSDQGKTVLGFGCQVDSGNRMADEFEICEEAQISSFQFFCYQTGSTAPGITGIGSLNIWDGRPGDCSDPGIIFSTDTTPPSLVEAGWTENLWTSAVYRESQTTPGCTRHQQTVIVHFDPPITLPAGIYWVDIDITDDNVVASGPWMAPLTNFGEPNTGNAMQFTTAWNQARDGSDDEFTNGIAFIVGGTGGVCAPGEQVPPPNDDMSNPTILACEFGTEIYDLTRATPDGPGASCAGGGGTCAGDLDGDNDVDVDDLLLVLGAWCPGASCSDAGDATGDGITNVDDLLVVLGAWGPCPPAGTAATANLWYSYTATVNDCIFFDAGIGAGIAVYDSTGTEIGCGFDNLQIEATVGATYLIELFAPSGPGALGLAQLEVALCPPCPNAEVLEFGVPASGNTVGAPDDPAATICDGIDPAGGGRWYSIVGDGNTLTATTCLVGTDFDTVISVYCGECDGLFCVGADDQDDLCFVNFVGESTFSWCSEAGRVYRVYVHGANSLEGNFSVQVTTDGSPCANPPVCTLLPCVEIPPNAISDPEACLVDGDDDTTNVGCNGDPAVFGSQLLVNGAPVTGFISTYTNSGGADVRDLDWFLVSHAGGNLTATLNSDFVGFVWIISDAGLDCVDTVTEASTATGGAAGGCVAASATATNLAAGDYYVVVSTNGLFEGVPCSDGLSAYVVTLTSP